MKTPNYPWQYIRVDSLKMVGNEVVADQYSRSLFIRRLRSTSSAAVIKNIKAIFEERGMPGILSTDNGPQFTSKEFADFYTTYSFLHKSPSSHNPSMIFAESMVGVCKRILLKVRQDSYLAMMTYRATPTSSNFSSQAELLNVRQIWTPFVSKQQLDDEQTRMAIQKQKDKSMD